jgi:hypothetical protein
MSYLLFVYIINLYENSLKVVPLDTFLGLFNCSFVIDCLTSKLRGLNAYTIAHRYKMILQYYYEYALRFPRILI